MPLPNLKTWKQDSFNLIDWFTSNQMKANHDKFQAIAIGKNTQSKKFLPASVNMESLPIVLDNLVGYYIM
jgi:hypothetical protein